MAESVVRFFLFFNFIVLIIIWGRSFILSGIGKLETYYSPAEGIIDAVLLRIFLTTGIICITIYILNPNLMDLTNLALPLWLRLIGIPLGLIANSLLFCALKSLGQCFCATLTIKEQHHLVTDGPYLWIRHPMYTAFVILWIAFFLLSTNWLIGLSGILACAVLIIKRTPKEERILIARFGQEYNDYMKRTGRFFPRLNKTIHDKP